MQEKHRGQLHSARFRGAGLKAIAIALNTYREAIRNKVLYSIVFFAFLVVGVSTILGAASIGDTMKFVKDFSLMSVSLFSVIIATVLGVNLLSNELGKKTIFNVLSKPVERWEFVVGKFIGLSATLALTMGLMYTILIGLLGAFEGRADWVLALAAIASFLEVVVVIAVALFFSSVVVTPTLGGMFTLATFVAGRSANYLEYLLREDQPLLLRVFASVIYWGLPHLNRFNLADQIVYGGTVDLVYVATLALYTLGYATIMLVLSILFILRRDFT
jgi:Cu-processing system permease protein